MKKSGPPAQVKVTKQAKLYGGHDLSMTGPKISAKIDKGIGHNAKGTFQTGPSLDKAIDKGIGHNAKGSGLSASGTKRDEKGEDKAGMAMGKRSNVKAMK